MFVPPFMNPHLTLTLSPPIGWERRGKSGWTRMVPCRSGEQRQAQGVKIKIKIRIKIRMGNGRNPHLTLTLSPPIGWERRGNSMGRRMVARKSVERRPV